MDPLPWTRVVGQKVWCGNRHRRCTHSLSRCADGEVDDESCCGPGAVIEDRVVGERDGSAEDERLTDDELALLP